MLLVHYSKNEFITEYKLRFGCQKPDSEGICCSRMKILDSELLNNSFKMSILDLVFEKSDKEIEYIINLFNSRLLIDHIVSGRKSNNLDINGIQHNEESIPQYLKFFIQNKDMNWRQIEMSTEDISGLGVIDFRYRT